MIINPQKISIDGNRFSIKTVTRLSDETIQIIFEQLKKQCFTCGESFPQRGKKKFCSRKCLELDKYCRYQADPFKRRQHNLCVLKRYYRKKGMRPLTKAEEQRYLTIGY